MKVEHIGIAVENLDAAVEYYKKVFPEAEYTEEVMPDQRIMIIKGDNVKIELLESLLEDSAIGKFIAKNGPGMHHIAFEVEDAKAQMAKVQELGLRTLSQEPYAGAENHMVFFLHPKDTFKVLTEFCQ